MAAITCTVTIHVIYYYYYYYVFCAHFCFINFGLLVKKNIERLLCGGVANGLVLDISDVMVIVMVIFLSYI